ncbi:hypothetical protein CEUSTIGMA_g11383.t1 [Chlamydomonas eustigma]|uniref:Cytochrome b5 heme-binding domain-containing protein n=1 Tax=Chlamydomonas eustigma TaxID=1157962 RepID=A0A250XM05_9CHLO|nr:hypothetical protein CEUSTIGMA_g11383.t1 [Chlamydomonas eustigma]|eukprot:GAX83959.1 hypothetical protein CEUSTIGMA_g11383.t1 [Chlamydomonas eustigma]
MSCPFIHSSPATPSSSTSETEQMRTNESNFKSWAAGNLIMPDTRDSGDSAQEMNATTVVPPTSSWNMRRPVLEHCPKLTRRALRKLNRNWSLEDVREHKYCDDAWIAVDGKVYDITEHIVDHPGWDSGCAVSTVLSILAHAGSECSAEFHDIHRSYPIAYKQLAAYYIGQLE